MSARGIRRIVAVGFLAAGAAAGVSYAACSCQDICNIQNVMDEAGAAQWEYQSHILRLESEDADSMFPTWFTPWRYAEIQAAVQQRINSASSRGSCPSLDNIASNTDGGSCAMQINAGTACLQEFATAHEKVHQAKCQSFNHNMTYQMSMSLAEVLGEEVRAYQTAIDKGKQMMNGPLKDCCCKNNCTPTGPGVGAALSTLKRIALNLLR